MIGLNYIWYKDSLRSKFKFFNDAKEWKQVDKLGHLHTAYFESVWATQMLKWAGVDHKKASIYGALVGFTIQSSIEIFDGFSEKWGASWSDIGFNALGSGMALTQNLLWKEQRIRTKYSFHQVSYPDAQLEQRAIDLYGEGKIERLIKDYNSLAIWVSITPSRFMKNPRPQAKWLALSLGYAGGDMYGGFDNSWEDEEINRIRATIYTERDTQKSIIIGKGGAAIKKLGTLARKDIEDFLQKHVYLELFVKVKENWRNDDMMLKYFGYKE
jgi:hypothetical protein